MEFEVNGTEYRAGKIDARKQFHIVRRLAPVMGGMVGVNDAEALEPLAKAIASLSDDDADYVLFGLLDCVSRKQANGLGWAKVSKGNALMFEDIDMAAMLKLAYNAMQANMQDFFAAIRSALNGQAQMQNAQ